MIKGILIDHNIKGVFNNKISDKWILDHIVNKSLFYSDGTITDGKLTNLKGNQNTAPSLVDSNCIELAVNDTIDFDDLSGWLIISWGGTAEIEISGNSVLCTSDGTLYNLIMTDGINRHYYPLAEGANTLALDTGNLPINGTINCVALIWTTQDEYHKNIEGYNTRDGIDILRQDEFTDSGTGVPVGWWDRYGKGGKTTINNVVRCTVTVGMTNAYHNSIYVNNLLNIGTDYKAQITIRASEATNINIRFGSGGASYNVAATTEWQTLETDVETADQVYFGVVATSLVPEWFEFNFVLVEEGVDEYYVPKRENSDLDAQGFEILLLGNGYFIEAETKLLFPDITIYQNLDLDMNMRFLYDRNNEQRHLQYSDFHDNIWGFERIFSEKIDGRLTKLFMINPQNFTRASFITLLNFIGINPYIYTKIENSCIILFNIIDFNGATMQSLYPIFNNEGITLIGDVGLTAMNNALTILYDNWVEAGNKLRCRLHIYYGNNSFEVLDYEEAEFAQEIIDGDLLVFDAPLGERGAVAKIDFPDFVAEGTLYNTTKQNGTVILDGTWGQQEMLWIPSGQSGVPAELEEIPLYMNVVQGKLYYYMWDAETFFGVTFTNADAINVYGITPSQYAELVSIIGQKCYHKHCINLFADGNNERKVHGFLETTSGDDVHCTISSPGSWDAGMVVSSNGCNNIAYKNTILTNQDEPRIWCTTFGHHDLQVYTTFNDLINALPGMASNNIIYNSQFENGWAIDATKAQTLIDTCKDNNIIIMSAFDFLKNMQFNDYESVDFD